jgi:DNA-binding NarL/FixJ family response regulator
VPIRRTGQIEEAAGGIGLSAEDETILTYLAAGLKDEVIARRLGIAPRTAQRRVARLMDLLGAETRFQAGLHATKMGWL